MPSKPGELAAQLRSACQTQVAGPRAAALLDPGVELDDRQQHGQHDQHHHAAHRRRSAAARGSSPAASRGAAPRRRAAWRRAASISGSWPVCSPRRENIASMPGKRFLPASAEASGAPSRTCTSASIASARIARLRQRLGRGLQRLQDRHAGAGQHRQRAGEARRVVAARQPADQRQVEPAGVEALAEGLVAQRQPAARRRRRPAPAASSQPQLRTKALIASIATVRNGSARFELGEHGGDLRHDVGDEEDRR